MRRFLFIPLILWPTFSSADDINFGANCSYTNEIQKSSFTLTSGDVELVHITDIPPDKEQVFFRLDARVDLDMKLTAEDGTVLLWFQGGVHWSFHEAISWVYDGMGFTACVDGCNQNLSLTFHDGRVHELEGSPAFSNEWLIIDRTTQTLHLEVEAYEYGYGVLDWMWDCPRECNSCTAVDIPCEEDVDCPVDKVCQCDDTLNVGFRKLLFGMITPCDGVCIDK